MNTSFDLLAETIRVLIGDDHRIVREGLKQILADAPDVQVVAEAPVAATQAALFSASVAPGKKSRSR